MRQVRQGAEFPFHFAGVALGLSIFALVYAVGYRSELTAPNHNGKLSDAVSEYSAIAPNNILQLWRVGATKAIDRNAQVAFVFDDVGACSGVVSLSSLPDDAMVRRVVSIGAETAWAPVIMRVASSETRLSELCRLKTSKQVGYWATASSALRDILRVGGANPVFIAMGK